MSLYYKYVANAISLLYLQLDFIAYLFQKFIKISLTQNLLI